MRRAIFVGLLITLGFSARIQSQTAGQEQKPEAVKIRSTEVLVDAVVIDRKNRLVPDLTAEDFEIYEDGVLQEVSSFRVIRGADEKAAEGRPVQKSAETATIQPSGVQPSGGETKGVATQGTLPNVIIALLDYSTTEFRNKKLIQDGAIKYVEKRLQPNDLMAVFVLGSGLHIASDFTNDKAKLTAALKSTDLAGTAVAGDRADLSATIQKGDLAENQVDLEGGAGVPSGPGAAAQGSAMAAALIAQHFAAMHISMRAGIDRIQSLGVLAAIRAIAAGVKGIQGRKTLLLFSEGFVVSPAIEDDLRMAEGLANGSQLAIYCIESQGLETREMNGALVPRDDLTAAAAATQRSRITGQGGETNFDRSQQIGQDVREGPLRGLANATGGLLIRNTNDLGAGLERIDREIRSHYLLSYSPKNEKLDGHFRQIRVAIKKPDLIVRARSGYYAMPTGYEMLSPAEFQLVEQAGKAEAASFPLFMRAGSFLDASRRFRVPVSFEIPYSAVRFVADKGKHTAQLQVIGLVRDQTGRLVQRFGEPVQMGLTDAQYNALKVGTISMMDQVRLSTEGDYSIQVLVKDVSSGLVANKQQTLHLERSEASLGLSSILLASDRELYKTSDTADPFLTVQGVKLVPSAACQFRNDDNMIFYFDIYNSRADADGKKADISIKLSFMREGKAVNAGLPNFHLTESPGPSRSRITFCRFLRLTALAPGEYRLVVSVNDGLGNQSTQGEAAFRVLN
jgi:VWFA-related protein